MPAPFDRTKLPTKGVVILVGPPSTGKTTFSKMIKTSSDGESFIVSSDRILDTLLSTRSISQQDYFNLPHLDPIRVELTGLVEKRILDSLDKELVVWDMQNTSPRNRERIVSRYTVGTPFKAVQFQFKQHVREIYARNRDKIHPIPEKILGSMLRSVSFVKTKENIPYMNVNGFGSILL
jgi:tRNA uridine 5-carbamoylmethylation protein Kti12